MVVGLWELVALWELAALCELVALVALWEALELVELVELWELSSSLSSFFCPLSPLSVPLPVIFANTVEKLRPLRIERSLCSPPSSPSQSPSSSDIVPLALAIPFEDDDLTVPNLSPFCSALFPLITRGETITLTFSLALPPPVESHAAKSLLSSVLSLWVRLSRKGINTISCSSVTSTTCTPPPLPFSPFALPFSSLPSFFASSFLSSSFLSSSFLPSSFLPSSMFHL